eukprot:403371470
MQSSQIFTRKRNSVNDYQSQRDKESIWTPFSVSSLNQSLNISNVNIQSQPHTEVLSLFNQLKLGTGQLNGKHVVQLPKQSPSNFNKINNQYLMTNFKKLNINKDLLISLENDYQQLREEDQFKKKMRLLSHRKSLQEDQKFSQVQHKQLISGVALNNSMNFGVKQQTQNFIQNSEQISLSHQEDYNSTQKSSTIRLRQVLSQSKNREAMNPKNNGSTQRDSQTVQSHRTDRRIVSKTPMKSISVFSEDMFADYSERQAQKKALRKQQVDDKSQKLHKELRQKLVISKEYTEKEMDLNFKGTTTLVEEQFEELLKYDIEKLFRNTHHQKIQENFMSMFEGQCKNFRYLIRVVKSMTDQIEDKNIQFQALRCFSVFWKSINEDQEKQIKQLQQTLKTTIQSFNLTFEKLTMDKKQLQDIVQDRENELRMFQDPKQMRELKTLLNDLEYNMNIVEKEKESQYSEMKDLMTIMDNYQKQQKDIQLQNKLQQPKIVLKRIKKKVNNSVIQKALDQNNFLRGKKQNEKQSTTKIDALAIKDQNMKELLFEIMGNEIDLYLEFKNQKEAVFRKEKILNELTDLIKLVQELDEDDEQYKIYSLRIEKLQDELLEINKGMIQGYQYISGEKANQSVQTDIQISPDSEMLLVDANDKDASLSKAKKKLSERMDQKEEVKTNNPILKAISQVMSSNIGQNLNQKTQQGFDPKLKLSDPMILKIMELTVEDKVKTDIDNLAQDQDPKKQQTFAAFLYDSILMQYGLKTIAVKNVVQLCNGLKMNQQQKYAAYLGRLIGVISPQLEKDQNEVILKSLVFFKDLQTKWIKTAVEKYSIKIADEQINNLSQGGECSICDIIDEIRIAFKDDREILERLLNAFKPEQLAKIDENNMPALKKFQLDYCLTKIIYKVSKIGKDIKYIYEVLDQDKSGSLDRNELISGLRNQLGIYIPEEESEELVKYLDSDGSGDIDFKEFSRKINFKDLQQKQHAYTISKVQFLNVLLKEWDSCKRRENNKIRDIFHRFDDNGDGVLAFNEFETLMRSLDPSIKKKQVVDLFRETLDGQDQLDDTINIETFIQTIYNNNIGGFGKVFFSEYLMIQNNINPAKVLATKKTR